MKRALTNVLNAYGKKAGIFKGEEKVSGDDCREETVVSNISGSGLNSTSVPVLPVVPTTVISWVIFPRENFTS